MNCGPGSTQEITKSSRSAFGLMPNLRARPEHTAPSTLLRVSRVSLREAGAVMQGTLRPPRASPTGEDAVRLLGIRLRRRVGHRPCLSREAVEVVPVDHPGGHRVGGA